MGVKEIVILLAILAFGYWLGQSGVIARYLPGN